MPAIRRSNTSRINRQARQRRNLRANQESARNRLDNDNIMISQEQQRRPARQRINYDRLAFNYDPMINYASDESVNFGAMSIICQYCSALRFTHEPPGLCCANGKVKLPQLSPPPEPLCSLVSGISADSKHFLANIQQYNNCFQMTSFGATNVAHNQFMPTFKVISNILFSLNLVI